MDYTITSRDNKLVKYIKSLHQRKFRDSDQKFFVEGIKITREALESGAHVPDVVICPEILERVSGGSDFLAYLGKGDLNVNSIPENIFKEISDTEAPQGVLALINKGLNDADKIDFNPGGIYLLLDGIQDPGNLGTILRTADAAGVNSILLSKGCADAYNPKTLRSTMGSIFRVNFYEKVDLCETALKMKQRGIRIIASSLEAGSNYADINYNNGIGLVIGSESNGVSPEMIEQADATVRIPMKSGIESLNASVAAGILLYEVLRNRGFDF